MSQERVVPGILDMSGQQVEPADGCGKCTACCTLIGVAELDKENFTHCKHICEAGCSIYEDRPKSCRIYNCLYRLGNVKGGEENRPDNLGILLDVTPSHYETPFGGGCMMIFEVWPGAAQEERAKAVIEDITKAFPALFICPDGVKVAGPEHLVRRAGPYLEAKGYVLEGDLYVAPDVLRRRKLTQLFQVSPSSTKPSS